MTASATHEVRNVLAIIKESAGLVEDMILLCSRGGTLDAEKVRRTIGRIDSQVKRGADLLTNLNRLSHTLDSDQAQVDLHQEAAQVVFLCQRFARKRGHSLTMREETGAARATVHPLRLQMALVSALRWCMDTLQDGASISALVTGSGDGATVDFATETEGKEGSPTAVEPERWAEVEGLVESLGATVRRLPTGVGVRILFPPE